MFSLLENCRWPHGMGSSTPLTIVAAHHTNEPVHKEGALHLLPVLYSLVKSIPPMNSSHHGPSTGTAFI